MAFEELLTWSAGRPLWQQDALRRLAERGELTEEDLASLAAQIEAAVGLLPEALAGVPLGAEHLSEAASNAPRTVLASLGPVNHVDRLEPGQPPIRFAVNGITLVYGHNASGKSGYCRIAKQLCRSLSLDPLRGNVFDGGPQPPPEVALAYRVGGDGDPKTERTWRFGDARPDDLARISVFDTASAGIYVDKERRIEFLPQELGILNKLGVGMRALDGYYKGREDLLAAAISAPIPIGLAGGTAAASLGARLSVAAAALRQLPSDQDLREGAAWTAADEAELNTLAQDARNNPQLMARSRRQAAAALRELRQDATLLVTRLGDDTVRRLGALYDDAALKKAAADTSAQELFSAQPIPSLGTESWRLLLRYAREFATESFPDREPPAIASAGLCVLCHQELDTAARERLSAFDEFIEGRTVAESRTAAAAYSDACGGVAVPAVRNAATVEAMLATYAGINAETKERAAAALTFFEDAATRLGDIRRMIATASFDVDALPAPSAIPRALADEEILSLEREARNLETRGREEPAAAGRTARIAELSDRKRLGEQIAALLDRRKKIVEHQLVGECRAQCRLTAVTQQITKRRREILTPSLRGALDRELAALRLSHIPLNLADRGDLGESIVEIALTAIQRIAANSEILSEGEQRGLALACFLAELNEIGTNHGIIVDDPVSSLDHARIETVARRLAEEAAKGRQVIVFRHNIVFHSMLVGEAGRHGVACHEEWMAALGNNRFGIIDGALKPWQLKPVGERLTEIAAIRKALETSGYDPADSRFRDPVVALYTRMRETWERVVEEILFNKAIQRFRPEVMTQRLESACYDRATDYPRLFDGMKRTSHYSGHDRAEDLPAILPTLDEIDTDIAALKGFADEVRDRQKKLEKSGKYEDGVPAVLI